MPRGYGNHKTAFKDLTSQTKGLWSVLGRGQTRATRIYWLCRCVCGVEKEVAGVHLVNGHSTNCGCNRPTGERSGAYKHGQSNKHPLYQTWMGMNSRCNDKRSARYGGRGIEVCDRWANDFLSFLADMGDRPSPMHSIDRIDNDKGYFPENCRWATIEQQSRNRMNNRVVEFEGVSKPLIDWSIDLGINYGTLKTRLNKGLSVAEAFTKPLRNSHG